MARPARTSFELTTSLSLVLSLGCGSLPNGIPASPERDFHRVASEYAFFLLERHPVVATYLGADGWRPDLAPVAGRFRDFSEPALAAEARFYEAILEKLDAVVSKEAEELPPASRVDVRAMRAQIAFLLRSARTRRHHLRSIDTYVLEPFRGIEWLVQGMTPRGGGRLGTAAEWDAVASRAEAADSYLRVAAENLASGVREGVVPDGRMIRRDGLDAARETALYFRETLPALCERLTAGTEPRAASRVRAGALRAAAAFDTFRDALAALYCDAPDGARLRPEFERDRFALGEEEYAFALRNNLGVEASPAALFEGAAAAVAATTGALVAVAREVAARRGLALDFETPAAARAAVRSLYSALADECPKSDAEMLEWHRETCARLVEYGREHRLFDVPLDYRLDVVETPPAMRASVDGAVYFPAPPWKTNGIGRFYITPTGGDARALRAFPRAGVADLCAHEGFPGHDWHYRFLRSRMRTREIGIVRTLLPGSVEDSASMWGDSLVAEGWALYGEELMGEPSPGRPYGAYSPEEKLFQLRWQLLRDVRVRVDVGIHTGRMTFDEAVAYFTTHVHFVPDAAAAADAGDPDARNALEEARRAIYRYSKWPTQAVTYALGKKAILELREAARRRAGERFDARAFHERVLGIGLVPLAFARDAVLEGEAPAEGR